MNLFRVMEISGSALLAERLRAEIVSANLANSETTRTENGGPYQRMHVVFGARGAQTFAPVGSFRNDTGVIRRPPRRRCASGERGSRDQAAPVKRFEPGHPDADAQGYVAYPAINPAEEMINLMGAARAYEINASAVTSTKNMIQSAIGLLS